MTKNSRDFRLDSDVILAAENLEESIISPIAVPRIGDEPVFRAIFNSPAKDANCMPTQGLASNVLINSWLVLHKIFVYCESSFNWSICVNLGHDVTFIALHRVWWFSKVLIRLEVNFVIRVQAFILAFRCWSFATARHSGSVHVMLTRLNLVGLAALIWSISAAADDSLTHPIRPCTSRESSVTTESTSVAARHEMLRREMEVKCSIGMNACTITHRFYSTECLRKRKRWRRDKKKTIWLNSPSSFRTNPGNDLSEISKWGRKVHIIDLTWSRISLMVGQSGQFSRESKFSGKSFKSASLMRSCGKRKLLESGWTPIIFLMLL